MGRFAPEALHKNEGAPLSSNNLVIVFHSGLAQGVANPPSRTEIGSDSFWGIRGEEKSDFLWIHSFARRGEELEVGGESTAFSVMSISYHVRFTLLHWKSVVQKVNRTVDGL